MPGSLKHSRIRNKSSKVGTHTQEEKGLTINEQCTTIATTLGKEIDTEKPPVTPQRDLGHETSVTHLPEPVTSMHQTLYHNHTKLIQTLNENEYEMFMFRKDRFLRPFALPEPISSTRLVITERDPIPVKEK